MDRVVSIAVEGELSITAAGELIIARVGVLAVTMFGEDVSATMGGRVVVPSNPKYLLMS